MKRAGAYILFLVRFNVAAFGQSGKKYVREGNRNFEDKQFEESEVLYRKAINEEAGSFDANFNLGDALYKQEKFDDAAGEFNGLADRIESVNELAKTYHNLGNSLLKSEKYEQSIAAYKNSLRFNPDDLETKYNLAYAKDQLKQQQQQQENQQKDKDQKQDKEQEKKEQDKEEQQQPQPQKISKEDANRLLKALANDEKKIQEKVKKAKAKMQKVKTEKDW